MNNIGNVGRSPNTAVDASAAGKAAEPGRFSQFMGRVADGALTAAAVVAPLVPGGQLIQAAVGGLRELRSASPQNMGAPGDQMDKMWAMQRENQVFNLQYMQLQEAVQSDNRRFSTMSNLMKVRHDTAKAAINNMHV
ncbi:MAG: hypothetical protein H0U74_01605 [Bradymonadaceae bacterium]|nr:hypothetical protein [Lujinxingiaceae bacterium]